MLSSSRSVVAALLLAVSLPSPAQAVDFISPGVKIGWTFGRGITYGFELSFIWDPQADVVDRDWLRLPYGHGLVFDVDTNFKGFWTLHAGYEAIGPFVGVEVGPTLVGDNGRVLFGIGLTPWAGYDVIPFYTYTFAFGGERNFHEMGTYLKLAMSPDDGDAQSAGSWDD
jgi:hypothetical protein